MDAAHDERLRVLPCSFVEPYKHFCFHASEAAARVRLGQGSHAAGAALEAILHSFAADQVSIDRLTAPTRNALRRMPWLALAAAIDAETRTVYHGVRAEVTEASDLHADLALSLIRVVECAAALVAWTRLCSVPNGCRSWTYLVELICSSWRCYWRWPPWRGANLGGWLLLEPGPAYDIWEAAKALSDEGNTLDSIPCEYSLCQHLAESGRKAEAIEEYRKNWLGETDFAYLQEHGLNAVRVPFGYWIVTGPTHGEPFEGPALHHLDHVVDMAERCGFQVLLDLHANPGGENGGSPAGRKDGEWKQANWRFDESLQVLRVVAERYAGRRCVTGLQVANEPSRDCSMGDMCDWFEKAIRIIRTAGMEVDQTAIVLPVYEYIRLEEFFAVWGSRGNLFRFENIAIDLHYYHVFWHPIESLDHAQHLAMVERHGHILQSLPGAVVGEWSLCMPDRIEASAEMKRQFGDAQLRAYAAASHGWFFWNYCDAMAEWDLDTCINNGWLPVKLGPNSDSMERCSNFMPRAPPIGRFPQCYGSEERRLLACMNTRLGAAEAPTNGKKRARSTSHDKT